MTTVARTQSSQVNKRAVIGLLRAMFHAPDATRQQRQRIAAVLRRFDREPHQGTEQR